MLASDAPANAEVRLNTAVIGENGRLDVFGHRAGPPNTDDAQVMQSITLAPCGIRPPVGVAAGVVVLSAETGPVASGVYTITLRDLMRPEGESVNESWTVALTCTRNPDLPTPATNCR